MDTLSDTARTLLQALDRYREIQSGKVFEVLERPGSVKKNLRQLFQGVVEKRALRRRSARLFRRECNVRACLAL